MSKKNDQKRKAQLAEKTAKESFAFQVKFASKTVMPELSENDSRLQNEIDVICAMNLNESILSYGKLMTGIKNELGLLPEKGMNSLDGTFVPYILGSTEVNPLNTDVKNNIFTNVEDFHVPLQVKIVYDNEIRNRVLDWLKAHGEIVTTRIGIPILKLPNMVVEINRFVRK